MPHEMLGETEDSPARWRNLLGRSDSREVQARSFYFPLQAGGRATSRPGFQLVACHGHSSPYLAQGEGLGAVPVEGVFERAQPGLSNANLVPQGGLLVRGGVGVLILVDVPHSRAGKDFNGAAAEPGLP